MELTKKVKKDKEKLFFEGVNIKDLDSLNISELIPTGAKHIEISYNDNKNLLVIDYITKLEVTETKK